LPMLDVGVWHCDAFLGLVSWRSFVKIRQLMSTSARRQNYFCHSGYLQDLASHSIGTYFALVAC
jgi:hypothetical protein